MSRLTPLVGWLSASAVALTGTRISMIALPWFVLMSTGDALLTGLVAAAEIAPLVACKALAGPLIDRVGPRRIAIACDTLSLPVIGAIPLLHGLGLLPIWALLAIVALAGALRGPGDAAKRAMIPLIADHGAMRIDRVTGFEAGVDRTAGMLGAGLAGLLVATVGAPTALVLDALGFGISALILAVTTRPIGGARANAAPPLDPGDPAAEPDAASYGARLRAGWRFLVGDRVLLAVALMIAVTNMLDAAYFSVLLPVWADEPGRGAALIGLLIAVTSGASALGSLAAAAWSARLPRYAVYLVAFLIAGVPRFAILAVDVPLTAILVVAAATGLTAGFINPVVGAVVLERIPAHLVGRVTSLITSIAFALMPLGGLLGGALVSAAGLTAALVVAGSLYLAATMVPAFSPRWRELDRGRTAESSGGLTAPVDATR